MHSPLVAESNRAQDLHGERDKMSEEGSTTTPGKVSLTRSNSAHVPTESLTTSVKRSSTTESVAEENHASSSTLKEAVSAWSARLRESPVQPIIPDREHALKLIQGGLSQEREQEGTLTLYFSTFGKPDQLVQTARSMVGYLICSAGNVFHATLNGTALEGDYENSEEWHRIGDAGRE